MPWTHPKCSRRCKQETVDEVAINDQVKLVDPRIKTGITVIIYRLSYRGVYADVDIHTS